MIPLLSSAAIFFCLLQSCNSTPLHGKRWDDFKVKNAWLSAPKNWELVGPAPPDHTLQLRIGLKQERLNELISSLYEVSDPTHPRYGAHLSKVDVDDLVAPHKDSIDLVDAWLAYHDIDPLYNDAGDWISAIVTVNKVEQMLGTKYSMYKHTVTSETIVRTMSYSLPLELHDHVTVVTPATYFGTTKPMSATSFIEEESPNSLAINANSTNCSTTITPSCLRTLYKTDKYVPQATRWNKLGIAGYVGEYANRNDLQTFFRSFRPDAVGSNFTIVQINGGGDNQTQPGIEANLDIQYTEGLSFPTPNIYYSTGGSPPFIPEDATPTNTNEPYMEWLHYILGQESIPQTFTTSYGDDEQTVPQDYAESICNMFAQLGVRGSSVIFSSGDYGVGQADCKTNDGTNRTQFLPNFPPSCPYVTAVGGTVGINPESAIFFSGGGFSNYFATPRYQTHTVAKYLEDLGDTNSGLFNASGRAYPDVAAQSYRFQVVVNGTTRNVGGTSASCPTFASIVSLLNDYLIANNKSPLGFLNPLLYSKGRYGFNDITNGTNPGCGTEGFSAVEGWDPVTGWGTPDFIKLQDIVLEREFQD